jgi:hypothetical protein
MLSPEQSGKQYEQELLDIVTPIFGSENVPATVAGSSLQPDIFLRDQFRSMVRIEAKTDIGADFGQKGITIDAKTKKWVPIKKKFSSRSKFTQKMDKLYEDLFSNLNLHDAIVNAWDLPNKKNKGMDVNTLLYMIETNELNKSLNFERQLIRIEKGFDPYKEKTLVRDIKDSIVKYYNSLNTFYLQIKNKGFYYMGEDKNKLNGKFREKNLPFSIPSFSPTESKLNLRGKTSASGGYFRPILRFKISGLSSSSVSLEDETFVRALYQVLWS